MRRFHLIESIAFAPGSSAACSAFLGVRSPRALGVRAQQYLGARRGDDVASHAGEIDAGLGIGADDGNVEFGEIAGRGEPGIMP